MSQESNHHDLTLDHVTLFLEQIRMVFEKEPSATPCIYYHQHDFHFAHGMSEVDGVTDESDTDNDVANQKSKDIVVSTEELKEINTLYKKGVETGEMENTAQAVMNLLEKLTSFEFETTKPKQK